MLAIPKSQSCSWDQEMSAVAFLLVHLALSVDGRRRSRWQCLTERARRASPRRTRRRGGDPPSPDRCRGRWLEHGARLVSHGTAGIRHPVGENDGGASSIYQSPRISSGTARPRLAASASPRRITLQPVIRPGGRSPVMAAVTVPKARINARWGRPFIDGAGHRRFGNVSKGVL